MISKPKQWSAEYAGIFKDQSVVDAYHYRPDYPPETFVILAGLIRANDQGRVLDAGCGTGNLARRLANYVGQVDAVDFSRAAIEKGKGLPGGGSPRLRWLCGTVEDANLQPMYDLITAGASLHWMDWSVVMPKFGQNLAPGGFLALVEILTARPPWANEIDPLLGKYSMNKDFRPYDNLSLAGELKGRYLFETVDMRQTKPVLFHQPLVEYIESFHARNGFSRNRMMTDEASEFDQKMQLNLEPYCPDGLVMLEIAARVIWGFPGKS